jgi:hypothetical protein
VTFDSHSNFIPGLVLSERFFHSAVQPLLATHFPTLRYSAALLGRGSDVMGFDTPQSRDHHWGPKTTLFLTEDDVSRYHDRIVTMLGNELPFTIDGYPTHFDQPNVDGGFLTHTDQRPIAHGVNVTTIARFTGDYLGIDATKPIDERAWLAMPSQRLRTVRSGRVFHDDLGLAAVRERLHWYPRDVWLYRMANQWRRIDQEEPWVGRCGDVGDELGSRIVATRLIVELMRLCFLIEREYWPYFKWFGTAFSRLRCSATLTPIFHDVMNASDWKAREVMIGGAYLHVGAMHNELGLSEVVEPRLAPFFGRPYQVPHAMRFVDALMGALESPTLRSLPPYVGSVDQFADSTDVLDDIPMAQALMSIYDVKP